MDNDPGILPEQHVINGLDDVIMTDA